MEEKRKPTSILNVLAIVLFLVLPHYWPFPFFTYAPVCLLILIWLLRYQKESLTSIGFSFSRFTWKAIPIGLLLAIGYAGFHLFNSEYIEFFNGAPRQLLILNF